LFNFGEPLLHPSLPGILKILVDYKLQYVISTNASKFIALDPTLLENLQLFMISIPGFSQSSYDRVHGFVFEEIKKNIDQWIELVGHDKIQVKFHVYRFSLDELGAASAYFRQRGVKFFPYFALIADYNLARSFLTHTMPQKLREDASGDLVLDYVDDFISSSKKQYRCPEWSKLTIDEYCNVLTCCAISKGNPDYSISSVFSLSKNEIWQKKINQDICRECISIGNAYWVHNLYRPDFIRKFEQ